MKSSISTVFNSSSFLLFKFVSCYSLLLLSHSAVVDSFSLSSEGEALLSLLNSFDSVPDSIKLSWNNSSTTTTTPCNWSGVSCNTQKTHVVSLDLNGYQITGQLGPQIGNLRYLKFIDLSGNNFNGSIPTELWNSSSHLQHLDLSENKFTGELPEAVGNSSHLQHLDLSANYFTGVLLPEVVSNLHQLNSFHISSNQFSGRIPESLFQISGLEEVVLTGNNFTSSIPLNIGNATNLVTLDLSSNNLSGELPVEMTELSQLKRIFLNNNQFSGLIPKALGINSTSLLEVDLSNNNFSGEIPPNLCFGKQLQDLRLGLNKLHGSIPSSYTENCYSLVGLLLYKNNLNGSLSHFDKNSGLEELNISENNIHGKIPSSICYLSILYYLDFSENNMNGTLPQCFGDMDHNTLNLRNNDFIGTLPLEFTSRQLYMLDLNGNRFQGKIPRIHYPGLTYLDLGNNQLNDTFPFFLAEILSDSLEILVLRSNKLYGSLEPPHHTHLNFSRLKVLDISSNYFTGDLPLEFYLGLEAMKHINNQYFNKYPTISSVVIHKGQETRLNITFMLQFRAIDMSNNTFQGTIPIGELVCLKMLNLSNNNLNGHIPSSLGNLTQLESLDLSHNKLSGEIPRHFTDIYSLAVLNLSYNNLTGPIPNGGQFSTFTNDSFSGNSGLCGSQMSRKCGDDANKTNRRDPIEVKPSHEDSNNPWSFGWEPVVIGYGCGVLIGLVIQYFVFTKAFLYRWFG